MCVLLLALLTMAWSWAAHAQRPRGQEERGIKLGMTPSPTPEGGAAVGGREARPELVMQTGHTKRVDGLAFSPDGRLFASGSVDSTVRLWETATGHELRKLTGHTAWVKTVAFSADGNTLAAAAIDGTIKLWDVATGREQKSINGAGDVDAIAFSPDAHLLAAGNVAGVVLLYDMTSGQLARTLTGHTGPVLCLAFSPDNKLLASGGRDTSVKLWDTASGQATRTLAGHTDRVRALAFSADGRRLASGSNDKTIKLWDMAKGSAVRTLTGHTSNVLAVAFGPTNHTLVSASADHRTVKIWDTESGRESQTITEADNIDTQEACAFSPDARMIASSNGDKTVLLRDVDVARPNPRVLATRSSGVYASAFSLDRKWFASGSKDNTVRLWETATGRELQSTDAQIGWITTLAFSPDSRMLVAGGLSGAIKLYDVESGRELRRLDGHSEAVNAVVFNPLGQLASASDDKTIKLWDIETGRVVRTFTGHTGDIESIAFSPDGLLLASGGSDKTIKLWAANSDAAPRTLAGHSGDVYAVAFSPDGQTLASAGYDKTIKLWDVASGHATQTFNGSDGFSAVAFSPDGKHFVAGDLRGRLGFWDLTGATPARTLTGHTDAINGLAFSSDGRWLTSASEDGSTRLWATDTGALVATLVSFNESNNWLVVAPDGLFDGAPEAWHQILWRFAGQTFNARPVEAYFNEFYYPGLLADILAGKSPHAPQEIALRDRRQPQVTIELAGAQGVMPATVSTRQVALRLTVAEAPPDAQHARGSGAQDVRLFRNGSLVKLWRGDVVQSKGGKAVIETNVPVIAGENRLMAYAFNHDNVKSANAELDLTGDASLKRQGTAYILAMGVNQYANPRFNLRYAVADAQTFGEEVSHAQARIAAFAHIEVVPLTNREATKANLLLALKRLAGDESPLAPAAPAAFAQLRVAQPEDTVIIYYAGHGLAQPPRFYLIPHDLGYNGERTSIDPASLRQMLEHCVSDRELETAFEGIDAAQIALVIDACNSGQALESEDKRFGPMNSKGLAQLAYEKGMFILTAAQGYQAAQEVAQLGHGLLTYALVVQGLREGAADDHPRDGQVVMGEWLDYATARVPQMQLEKMRAARGIGAELALVDGEKKIADPNNRSLQRPRVFYRRELAERPLVVTRLGATQAQTQ
jgi:WD40 repeat protein